MPFRTSRIILFGDCDPGGVIYSPRVAHFLVEAGLEFLSHALGGPAARRLFSMNILPPARALSIEFLHPMVWDEPVESCLSGVFAVGDVRAGSVKRVDGAIGEGAAVVAQIHRHLDGSATRGVFPRDR